MYDSIRKPINGPEMAMSNVWKIAAVQMNCELGQPSRNLERINEHIGSAAKAEARLVIFPECALAGYCYESRDEAWPHAQPVPGPAIESLTRTCRDRRLFVITGLLERAGDQLYN